MLTVKGPVTGLSERELLTLATTVAPVNTTPPLIITLLVVVALVVVAFFVLLFAFALRVLFRKCVVAVDIIAADAEAGRNNALFPPVAFVPPAPLLLVNLPLLFALLLVAFVELPIPFAAFQAGIF